MRQFVEKRIARERETNAQVDHIRKGLWEQQILSGHGKSAKRVDAMRVQREEDVHELARQKQQLVVETETKRQQKEQINAMEESIAKELEKRHAEKVRTEMNRRRICEGSEELRDLRLKLQTAVMNKERKTQFQERIGKAADEKEHDVVTAAAMEVRRQAGLKAEELVENKKHESRLKAKAMNIEQIEDHQRYMQEEGLRVFLKDKAQVQDIVDKIAREDAAAEEKEALGKRETMEVLNKFRVDQDERRQRQLEEEIEENRKIEEYAENKRKFEAAIAAEKERLEQIKKERLRVMMAAQAAQDKEKEEMEYYLNELHQEELEALSRRREEMELRKKLEDRVEMHRAYEQQMRLKEEKRISELEKEDQFRKSLLLKFANDDRVEQMNEQKRRMRVEEHKREVARLWVEKERIIQVERTKDNEELVFAREQEKMRQVIIEEERLRLLQEVGRPLKEYLPKAVFETDDDHTMVMGRKPIRD